MLERGKPYGDGELAAPDRAGAGGKVPGLSVQRRADGSYAVRLRGARAPGGGDPLILLDGVPLSGPAGRSLADIDPQQVQEVEVIKDAASLSLYGTRGANGVIAITTRTR